MSNFDYFDTNLVSGLLLDETPLVILPKLAKLIGLNEAIVFQQIHYWIRINRKANRNYVNKKYWTYNSIKEWEGQFPFFNIMTIRRTLESLEKRGIVIVDNHNSDKRDRTNWYTIDYEKLISLTNAFVQNEQMEDNNDLDNNLTNGNCPDTTFDSSENSSETQILSKEDAYVPPLNPSVFPFVQNEQMHLCKMNKCNITENTNIYKEEERARENFLLKKDFQPCHSVIEKIKNRHLCSDGSLQESLKDFIKYYTINGQMKRDWNKAFELWCDNRKSWKEVTPKSKESLDLNKKISDIIDHLDGEEKEIMKVLLKEFGEPVFISWISRLKLIKSNIDCLLFKAPNSFIKDFIDANYLETIKRSIKALKINLNNLEIVL